MSVNPARHIEYSNQEHQQHHALHPRATRTGSWVEAAHVARTKLDLVLTKQVIQLAANTNAKGRLEEEKQQAGATHQHVNGTYRALYDNEVKHQQCQREANCPCKAFLWSPHILRLLLANYPLTQNQAG